MQIEFVRISVDEYLFVSITLNIMQCMQMNFHASCSMHWNQSQAFYTSICFHLFVMILIDVRHRNLAFFDGKWWRHHTQPISTPNWLKQNKIESNRTEAERIVFSSSLDIISQCVCVWESILVSTGPFLLWLKQLNPKCFYKIFE